MHACISKHWTITHANLRTNRSTIDLATCLGLHGIPPRSTIVDMTDGGPYTLPAHTIPTLVEFACLSIGCDFAGGVWKFLPFD